MNIFQRKAASVLRQTILNSHKHSSTFPVLHLSFYSTVSTRKQHPHHLHSSPCFHTHEPTRQYHQEEGSVAFVSSLHSSSCGQNNRHQSPRTTRSFSSALFRNMSLTRHASPFISPTPATPSPHTFSVGVVLPAMAPTSTRFFHSSLKTQYNVPSHMNFNEGGGGGHQHSGGNSVWRRIRNWTLGLGGVYVFYLSLPYLMYIGGIGIAWYAGRSGFRFLRNEYNKRFNPAQYRWDREQEEMRTRVGFDLNNSNDDPFGAFSSNRDGGVSPDSYQGRAEEYIRRGKTLKYGATLVQNVLSDALKSTATVWESIKQAHGIAKDKIHANTEVRTLMGEGLQIEDPGNVVVGEDIGEVETQMEVEFDVEGSKASGVATLRVYFDRPEDIFTQESHAAAADAASSTRTRPPKFDEYGQVIEEEDVRFESLIIRLDSGREIVVVDRTRNIGMDDGDGYGGGGGTIIDAEAVEVK